MAETRKVTRIKLEDARVRLISLWGIGSFILFFVFALMSSLGGIGEDDVGQAWGWLLPAVLPTLSLAIGVYSATGFANMDRRSIKKSFWRLVYWLSIGYFLLIALPVCAAPFSRNRLVELLVVANYWIGPFQGLVSGAIGYLFVAEEEGGDSRANRSKKEKSVGANENVSQDE